MILKLRIVHHLKVAERMVLEKVLKTKLLIMNFMVKKKNQKKSLRI